MRQFPRILMLCLLAAGCCTPAFAATARWTGKGETDKASDGMNWNRGNAPGENDYVVFSALSAKDCSWDLNIKLYYLAIKKDFKGTVRLQTSSLTVTKNVNVEGGKLDLQEGSLTVGRRIYVGSSGTFDLSNGTLSVGPTGILVDAGGTFLSTGHSQARVMSAKHKRYYKFI
ncbi:MAG: hypothetical protein Q7R35_18145, partial [Elusimicrobiota bacterium]|nr:hypothetical protein [Elusimicrobiota bacterium]